MDSALNPAWGNTAENVSTVIVPKGTTIFEGAAAPEGGLLGGGNQVYIPKVNPNWLVPTP
jgi:filamentous hemagglutinin